MSSITILYGTESGNSEMTADDISEALENSGIENEVIGMAEYNVADLADAGMVILITSTYGEGDLPETTAPFYDSLCELKPNLASLRFAAFGLGDSTYKTFNKAISTLTKAVVELGATQVGDTGLHDAASGKLPTDTAVAWAEQIYTRV